MPTYKEKKQKLRELVKQQEEERIKKIQEEGHSFKETDSFKCVEKHYKYYKHRETDFTKVLKLESDIPLLGQIDGTKVYAICEPQGAFIFKGFIPFHEQMQIGFEALNRYIYRPYRTNLDGNNGLQSPQQMQQESQTVRPVQVRDETTGRFLYYFDETIRMANLGYQYDWPHRSYPSTKVPLPASIHKLTANAVSLFQKVTGAQLEYHGQTAIINYYKVRDYMTGHLDDGQVDQKSPIFSFCLGLSCIFLLGFPTKEKAPVAVRLDAGDVMVMSGHSRICYHGVPRVLEHSYVQPEEEDLDKLGALRLEELDCPYKCMNSWKEVANYYKSHRLNINIRQVYPREHQEEVGDPCSGEGQPELVKKQKVSPQ